MKGPTWRVIIADGENGGLRNHTRLLASRASEVWRAIWLAVQWVGTRRRTGIGVATNRLGFGPNHLGVVTPYFEIAHIWVVIAIVGWIVRLLAVIKAIG